MNNKIIISATLALIAGAGIGFFGGSYYQKTKTPTFIRQFNGQGFVRGANTNGRGGFRPTAGQIISKDDKSITVKLMDGSSKIVILSGTTEINKAASGSASDLTVGQAVAVFGTENSDGSVTAQSIQLNPLQFRGGQNITPTP